MQAMIEIEGLTKDYQADFWKRKVRALDGFSVRIERGDLFAFLGLNGSGKTTTFKLINGLIRPTSGSVRISGFQVPDLRVRKLLGYLPESPYFYDYLTPVEILTLFGHCFDLGGTTLHKRIDSLLELVELGEHRHEPLRKFSKGMLQRVGIAQALIGEPELLLLDEPMSGLDPLGRKQMRELILRMKDRGTTVFLSTHIVSDIELLCEKVAIIHKGRLVEQGHVNELLGSRTKNVDLVLELPPEELVPSFEALALRSRRYEGKLHLTLADEQAVHQALEAALAAQLRIESLVTHRPTLEELFVAKVFT